MHAAVNGSKSLDLVATGSGIDSFDWIACWTDISLQLDISAFDEQDGTTLMSAQGDEQPLIMQWRLTKLASGSKFSQMIL